MNKCLPESSYSMFTIDRSNAIIEGVTAVLHVFAFSYFLIHIKKAPYGFGFQKLAFIALFIL